jgi:3-oxoacyl-[acyl-carrier protein] reductase
VGAFELGIEGRRALVCGSSAGLGRGCATALARGGADVVINGRNENSLRQASQEIAALTGRPVTYVVGDVTTTEGRHQVLANCPAPDILITNAAGPPPGEFFNFTEHDWQEAARVSMISPIMMMKSVLDGMIERRWGRIINITSSAVKAPLPLLHLSNGARSGLTGLVAGLAREVAVHGVTINNLLPGRFETDRLKNYIAKIAERDKVSAAQAAERMSAANPMKRFGTTEEFGAIAAFLASAHAAYITAQNILVDGGEYPGLL